jgi:hypothetical protein
VISCSHSSSFSAGRAFNAGKPPTIPDVHWAITSAGQETMNNGAPIIGRRRFDRIGGKAMARA